MERTKINGYDVFLINTHTGNGIALTANVQVGSWHDDPIVHAGRAHLWEHWIHGGSRKYPGHKTFFGLMSGVGGSYNAYTSKSRTFYHWFGHPDGIEEAADYLGAMLSEPEWNFTTFKMERSTVKNEAQEYQNQDVRAVHSGMYLRLLPEGHPLRMYEVGTQAQLDAMDPMDLKSLFYSNYVPGSMQLVVAANFDPLEDGKTVVTREQILDALRRHFRAPDPRSTDVRVAPRGKELKLPTILPKAGEPRLVEFGTAQKQHLLKMTFEPTGFVSPGVRETLLDYLHLPAEGGLVDELQRKGWITGLGFYTEEVNDLRLVSVQVQLTPEGAPHRSEIIETIFSAMHDVRENGIREDVLDYLKKRNVLSYQKGNRNAETVAEYLARFLDSGLPPESAFDYPGLYEKLNTADIKRAVSTLFDPDRCLMVYLGPDVKSSEKDPIFNRPMTRPALDLTKAKAAFQKGNGTGHLSNHLRLSPVELSLSEKPLPGEPKLPRHWALEKDSVGLLEENHAFPSGGAIVDLKTPVVSVDTVVAMRLFIGAFFIRYKGEMDFLRSMNLPMSIGAGVTSIKMMLSGNSGAVPGLVTWMLEKLTSFQPEDREMHTVRERTLAHYRRSRDEFTAITAVGALKPFLSGLHEPHDDELIPAFEKLPLNEVVGLVKAAFYKADVTVALAGDFNQASAEDILARVRAFVPKALDPVERQERTRRVNAPSKPLAFWQELPPTKSDDQFGWARAFPGPAVGTREHAALAILIHELGEQVFQLNRIQKELGYVHRMSYTRTRNGVRPLIYGQTEGLEKAREIEKGWNEVLGKVATGTVSQDGFVRARRALIRDELLLPYEESEIVDRLYQDFELAGNPNATEAWKTHLRDVTEAEIYAIGKKYLLGVPVIDARASRKPVEGLTCAKLLQKPSEVRTAIHGNP